MTSIAGTSGDRVAWLLVLAATLACLMAWTAASGHALTVVAVVVAMVVLVPLLANSQPIDLFAPWNYLFYFVGLNIVLRCLFIDFGVTGNIVDLNAVFYLDKPDEFMIQATMLMLVGFVVLTIGYLLAPARSTKLGFRIFRTEAVASRRLRLTLFVMLCMSGAALAAFIYLTFKSVGEFALALLSSHRGLSDDLEEYRAYGYLRLFIGFASIATYLSYIRLKRGTEHKGFYRLMLAAGILISFVMAIYSQSRAALIFVFLNIFFVKYYLDGRRFPWRPFAIAAPLIVMLFVGISSLRRGSGVDLSETVTPMTIVAPIVLNNGGIDASKTLHVANYVDDTQDFHFGLTLVQFVVAVVPRQLWPDKPVNLDTYIGERIYGAETYGAAAVPPGFFAEMYMNFGLTGILLGALLLGIAMKKIRNLLVANWTNCNFVVCYVLGLQHLGMSILGSGFSSAIMGVLMSCVPLVLALTFVTPKFAVTRERHVAASPDVRVQST